MFNWFKKDKDLQTQILQSENSDSPGFLDRLKQGLTKTRKEMSNKLEDIFTGYKGIDDGFYEDLEDILVSADAGAGPSMKIIERLRNRVREERLTEPAGVKELLKDEIKKLMTESVPDNHLIDRKSTRLNSSHH